MTITLRIDANLKPDCDAIFEDLGLSLSGAVTLFLRQVVKQRAIPFAISCDKVPSFGYYPPNVMPIRERAERAKRFAATTLYRLSRSASDGREDRRLRHARRRRRHVRGVA